MRETVRLTREKVFELVWSGPKNQIAKDLGISDVAFTRICRKLSVPMPPRGHWVRKRRRKKPTLLPTKGATFHDLKISEIRSASNPEQDNPQAARLIAFEKKAKNTISVKQKLRSPHPLVSRTKEALLASELDHYGRIQPTEENCLSVNIGPRNIQRSLLILDAILSALSRRGIKVEVGGTTKVKILGEPLSFCLEERSRRVIPTLTREQRRLQKKAPWLVERVFFEPTGLLTLKIFNGGSFPLTCLSDGRRQRLENCLNQFVIFLIRAALVTKADRQRQMDWVKELARREEELANRRRLQAEENARIEQLKRDAADWEQSRLIRQYVDAAREKATEAGVGILPESQMGRWISWALAQADLLDPLITHDQTSVFIPLP